MGKAVFAFVDKHFTALVVLASAFLLAWAIVEYSRANRFEFIKMDGYGVMIDRLNGRVYLCTRSQGCVDIDVEQMNYGAGESEAARRRAAGDRLLKEFGLDPTGKPIEGK